MKIAKASDNDINKSIELCGILDALESGFMPSSIEMEFEEAFDCDSHEDCHAALNLILTTLQKFSIGRVIWGMAALCEPDSKILNPDSDILELHHSWTDRIDKLKEINAELIEVLKKVDEAMAYMSEYDIPIMLPDRVKAVLEKASGKNE